jgi:hypothetical protein
LSTVVQLPERPSIEQLRKRARELARADGLKLSQAQLRVARMYGFASWPKLKAHVEMVTTLSREPEAIGGDDFLALVCVFGNGSPQRRSHGLDMLEADPSLATSNIWHAAACARADAIEPALASAQGGPFEWEPLLYLCYSRVPSDERSVLATATALLDAGADPNVGYLWHGLPTPFTALTGVVGGGEIDQPPHEHSDALARLLLERGADANDAQALYNRQFRPGTEHLELLFEFGLGRGDGGPWRARLGTQMESPFEMVQHQLRWAIHHNMLDRVRLFAERGVDVSSPFAQQLWPLADGRTPAEFAMLCGHRAIVDELAKHGTLAPKLDPVDQFVAAVMAGEKPEGDAEAARQARPSLVVQAAAIGRLDAVRLAVGHGFDVNALGRSDAPAEQPWETALHTAVQGNDVEMVRLLLQLGADRSIEDARFHATPLGWAQHFGHADIAAILQATD